MGSNFKNAIFDEQVQVRLAGWAQKAKKKGLRGNNNQSGQGSSHDNGGNVGIQLGSAFRRAPSAPENNSNVPRGEESVWKCSHVMLWLDFLLTLVVTFKFCEIL